MVTQEEWACAEILLLHRGTTREANTVWKNGTFLRLGNPSEPGPPLWGSSNIFVETHHTFESTPLYEWSARRRDLYLTTHNTHTRLTSMPQAGFEPAVPASEQPQTHALDRAATGIGTQCKYLCTNLQFYTSLWKRETSVQLRKPQLSHYYITATK